MFAGPTVAVVNVVLLLLRLVDIVGEDHAFVDDCVDMCNQSSVVGCDYAECLTIVSGPGICTA